MTQTEPATYSEYPLFLDEDITISSLVGSKSEAPIEPAQNSLNDSIPSSTASTCTPIETTASQTTASQTTANQTTASQTTATETTPKAKKQVIDEIEVFRPAPADKTSLIADFAVALASLILVCLLSYVLGWEIGVFVGGAAALTLFASNSSDKSNRTPRGFPT